MKILKTSLLLLALHTSIGAFSQTDPKAELDAITEKIITRSAVLSMGGDLAMQLALPPQYAQCLHVSFVEAQNKNPVAHRFLLEQIDFLTSSGLDSSTIRALISFGHALTNYGYAAENRRPMDKLTAEDLPGLNRYTYQTFAKFSCVEIFSDTRLHSGLKRIIQATNGSKK